MTDLSIFQEESTIYGGLLKVLFISSDILFILRSSQTIANIWSGHLAWPPADFVH